MKKTLAILVAAIALLAAPPAFSQDLEALQKAEDGVIQVWTATPLVFRRAVFTAAPAQGFGVFAERQNAVFKASEPLLVYAEPVGYAWKDKGDGTFSFGFDVDLVLKTATGEIVGGQENFQKLELTSRARNREFMLTFTLNVNDAPAGDYVLEYRIRDINSDKAGVISLPFTISQ